MDNLTANSAATENQARSVQGGSLTFDALQRPIPLHFILSTRSGRHIREIPADNVRFHDTLMNGSEVSFLVYKEKCIDENGEIDTRFWNKIKDLKLIYCKDLDMFYELRVNLTDSDDVVKSVTALSLGEAETSQCNVYGIEVNTEDDIARDDYSPCILYDSEHSDRSLIDRLFSKMQHYDVAHVDSTIARIQRTFRFDGQSIHDCCQEIEKEIGCLFKFECRKASGNKIRRTVSVYDMMSTCDVCGARGEFSEVCESCGSTLIHRGYGKDTGIYISRDNLAESIEYEADTDSVKNCFRLNGGDELMNAAIIAQNPNGSQYIWYISDDMREDMSPALRDRLDAYDAQYDYYQKTFTPDIQNEVTDSTIRSMIDFYDSHYSIQISSGDKYNLQERYNMIVDRYISYNEDLCKIMGDITGYPKIMEAYYNTIDLELFLRSGLMPNVGSSKTNAESEASKLTSRNLSPCAVADLSSCSKTTADNAVINMARCIVKPSFNVKINNSSYSAGEWRGSFTVSNYSDDEDTATTQNISVTINGDVERYIKQKIDTAISREREDATDILGLFSLDEQEFRINLRKYCLKKLEGFRDSCQVSLDTMIQHGVTGTEVSGSTMAGVYENLYRPYRQKIAYIENEIKARDTELAIVTAIRDESGNIVTDGMQSAIEKNINRIHDGMNFENFVGQELMREFSSFRRDDVYENSNYISDGLDNRELFQRAAEFIDTAKREIARAARVHHKVTANLSDLFTMKEFQPIVKDFLVGNKLHIKIDDRLYTLRLSEYEIDYNTFELSNVVFSDVVDGASSAGDIGDILGKAKSISTSYNSVKRQASAGKKSNDALQDIAEKGLRLTTHIVGGAHNQEFLLDESGYLGRTYIPETDSYSPEQIKIISNGLYVTNDAWETMKAALGKFQYYNPKTDKIETGFGVIAEQLVGGMLLSEEAGIYNENGSVVIDENGINMIVDSEGNTTAFKIQRRDKNGALKNIFNIDASGNLVIDGSMEATTGYIGSREWGFTITENSIYNGVTHLGDISHDGVYIGTDGIVLGKGVFKVDKSGKVDASNLSITGGDITIKKGNKVTFSVTNDGTVTASDLWITGGDINIRDPETGKYFKVDPKGSVEASSMNIFGGSIAIGGSNGIPAFSVTSTGSATVSNLTITGGAISLGTAVNGGLPPFYVDNDGDAIVRSLSLNGGSISLGTDLEHNPMFYADNDGAVTARNLTLTGGGISLGGTLSDPMFYAGNDGAVTARNLTLTGGTINISKDNSSIFSVSSNGSLNANFAGGTLTIGDKFKLNQNGVLTAGGFTIDDNAIYSNGLNTWQPTRKRAATKGVDDVVSGVYIGPEGIRLGDKFRVDAEGNLYASSGTFENEVWASNIKWGIDENTGTDYGVLSGGAIGGDGTLNGAVVAGGTLPGGAITTLSITGDRIGYGEISGGRDQQGNLTGQLTSGVLDSLGYANAYNFASSEGTYNGGTNYPSYFTAGNISIRGALSLPDPDSNAGRFIRTPKIKSWNYTVIKQSTGNDQYEVDLLDHYHQLTEQTGSDGKPTGRVVLGKPYWSTEAPFFNIADTAYFKQQMSAAQSGSYNSISSLIIGTGSEYSGDPLIQSNTAGNKQSNKNENDFTATLTLKVNGNETINSVSDADISGIIKDLYLYRESVSINTDDGRGYDSSTGKLYLDTNYQIRLNNSNGQYATVIDYHDKTTGNYIDIDLSDYVSITGITKTTATNVSYDSNTKNISGDFTVYVNNGGTKLAEFEGQQFIIPASSAYNAGADDAKANYISYRPSSPAGYLNGLIASTNGYRTSGDNKYVQASFDLTAGHQISGSSDTAYNFTSTDCVFNVDVTTLYNTAYRYGYLDVDSIQSVGGTVQVFYETDDSGDVDYTKLWIMLENDNVIHDIDVSGAYNAGASAGRTPRTITSSSYALITEIHENGVDNFIPDYSQLDVTFSYGSGQTINLPLVGDKTLYQYAYDLGYDAPHDASITGVTYASYDDEIYNYGPIQLDSSRSHYVSDNDEVCGRIKITLSDGSEKYAFVKMSAAGKSSSGSGGIIVNSTGVIRSTNYSGIIKSPEQSNNRWNVRVKPTINGTKYDETTIDVTDVYNLGASSGTISIDRTITSSIYPNSDYTKLQVSFTTGDPQEIDLPTIWDSTDREYKTLYNYAYDIGYRSADVGITINSTGVSRASNNYYGAQYSPYQENFGTIWRPDKHWVIDVYPTINDDMYDSNGKSGNDLIHSNKIQLIVDDVYDAGASSVPQLDHIKISYELDSGGRYYNLLAVAYSDSNEENEIGRHTYNTNSDAYLNGVDNAKSYWLDSTYIYGWDYYEDNAGNIDYKRISIIEKSTNDNNYWKLLKFENGDEYLNNTPAWDNGWDNGFGWTWDNLNVYNEFFYEEYDYDVGRSLYRIIAHAEITVDGDLYQGHYTNYSLANAPDPRQRILYFYG